MPAHPISLSRRLYKVLAVRSAFHLPQHFKEPDMNAFPLRNFIALPVVALALAGAAMAADIQTTPVQNAQVDDFAAGKKAIDAKNWSEAVSSFNKVVAKNPKNADAYNYLGYSNRWLGQLRRGLRRLRQGAGAGPQAQGRAGVFGRRLPEDPPEGPGRRPAGEAAGDLRRLRRNARPGQGRGGIQAGGEVSAYSRARPAVAARRAQWPFCRRLPSAHA
jgi:hypothetical protein